MRAEMFCDAPAVELEWRGALDAGHVLVLGEMHGTDQSPAVAEAAVCAALRQGRGVALFVEWPAALQGRLGDPSALVADPFFAGTFQDGRRSDAMLAMVTHVEAWARAGAPVVIVTMDPVNGDRDAGMAEAVRTWTTAQPDSVVVVLVGNIHARLASGWRENAAYKPMAFRLMDFGDRLRSLDVRYADGSGWNCQPDCGVHSLNGEWRGDEWQVAWSARRGVYDGTYYIGVPTASRPAKESHQTLK